MLIASVTWFYIIWFLLLVCRELQTLLLPRLCKMCQVTLSNTVIRPFKVGELLAGTEDTVVSQREFLLLVCAIGDTDGRGGGVGVAPRRNTFGLGAASSGGTAERVVEVSGGAAEVVGALAGTERHVGQRGVGGTV